MSRWLRHFVLQQKLATLQNNHTPIMKHKVKKPEKESIETGQDVTTRLTGRRLNGQCLLPRKLGDASRNSRFLITGSTEAREPVVMVPAR